MNTADVLKLVGLVALLVCFAAVGIGCLVNPDWGIRHFGSIQHRGGGDLRREWNRVQVQILGALMTGFVLYLAYHIIDR